MTDLKENSIEKVPVVELDPNQVPPHSKDVNILADNMFNKIAEFIQSDLNSSTEEYNTLIDINTVATKKYKDMRETTQGIANNLIELNEKFLNLQKYLVQIDKLDETVSRLENMAYKIDSYSKRLESHYKSLEKNG